VEKIYQKALILNSESLFLKVSDLVPITTEKLSSALLIPTDILVKRLNKEERLIRIAKGESGTWELSERGRFFFKYVYDPNQEKKPVGIITSGLDSVIVQNLILDQKGYVLRATADSLKHFLYSDTDLQFLSFLLKNQYGIRHCHTAWGVSLKIHNATSVKESLTRAIVCGSRNCPYCYNERIIRIKERLKTLWRTFDKYRPFLKTSHIILTYGEFSEITKDNYQNIRRLLRNFLKALSREKYNYWGFGCLELKYDIDTGTYKPHVHLASCGYVASESDLQRIWNRINGCNCKGLCTCGKWRKLKVKFCPSKKKGESSGSYMERLRKRRYILLDYFARRCAGAGLVVQEGDIRNGEPKDIIIGQIPDRTYYEIVYKSRLFISFGQLPKGILARWEQLRQEIEDENKEYTLIFLGKVLKDKTETIPPPDIVSIGRLTGLFNQLCESSDLDIMGTDWLWQQAFREFRLEEEEKCKERKDQVVPVAKDSKKDSKNDLRNIIKRYEPLLS